MIKVNLDENERQKLLKETNEMISECDKLYMDIFCLKDQLSKMGMFDVIFYGNRRYVFMLLEKKICIYKRRLSILEGQVELNKEILGLKQIKKKKNKTL